MKQIKEAPSIGVGVTAYNAEKYLGECLDSLLAQTYPNVRIVVCEDCSQITRRTFLGLMLESILNAYELSSIQITSVSKPT